MPKCLQKVRITAGRMFSAAAEFFGRTGQKFCLELAALGMTERKTDKSHGPEIYALSKMKINMQYRKHFTVYLSYKFVQHI